MRGEPGTRVRVTVVWSPGPQDVREHTVTLPQGATAAQAVRETGWADAIALLEADPRALSVWGRRVPPDTVLRDDDRVEVTRALRVDPKIARRERFRQQGARAAGLFARRPRR